MNGDRLRRLKAISFDSSRLLGAVTIAILTTALSAAAQERSVAKDTPQVQGGNNDAAAADQTPAADDLAEEQRRQNLATVMLMLLGGMLVVGIAMIAGTMIWGSKLRRLVRKPDAIPARQDELWYLKTPPPDDDETHPASSEDASNVRDAEEEPPP